MGKYVSVKMPKYSALVYPIDAANAVVDAWKRAVTEFGQEMRANYVSNILEAATEPEKIRMMEQGLAKFYERLIPIKSELKSAVTPVREQYKMSVVEELRRRGTAPAPTIVVKKR